MLPPCTILERSDPHPARPGAAPTRTTMSPPCRVVLYPLAIVTYHAAHHGRIEHPANAPVQRRNTGPAHHPGGGVESLPTRAQESHDFLDLQHPGAPETPMHSPRVGLGGPGLQTSRSSGPHRRTWGWGGCLDLGQEASPVRWPLGAVLKMMGVAAVPGGGWKFSYHPTSDGQKSLDQGEAGAYCGGQLGIGTQGRRSG